MSGSSYQLISPFLKVFHFKFTLGGDINHNYITHLYEDSKPTSDCLANAYQILSVPDLWIQDKHSYSFLNNKHCRERSFSHKCQRIYSALESRGARQWHLGQR